VGPFAMIYKILT